jgi:hypothetical protein
MLRRSSHHGGVARGDYTPYFAVTGEVLTEICRS